MKKRRAIGIFDLGRIPVTPTKYADDEKPTTTLAAFRSDEARREQEKAARMQNAIAEKQSEFSRTLQECLATSAPTMTKFWSQPLDRIKSHLHDEEVFDNLFLATSEDEVDSNAVYDTIQGFLHTVPTLTGWNLGEMARRRFGLYVASQVNAGVVIDPESLLVMMRRCIDLGIFKPGAVDAEATFDEALAPRVTPRVKPVEQPSRATMQDLMEMDDSRDGVRRAHNIVQELYLLDEMRPLMTEWVTSIQRQYGFSPTEEDLKRIGRWFERNNFSFLDPRNYDAARRWMVASGYWSETCLMEIEKFNLSLESIDTSRLTVAQRNDLNRRELQAREADAARFGQ